MKKTLGTVLFVLRRGMGTQKGYTKGTIIFVLTQMMGRHWGRDIRGRFIWLEKSRDSFSLT